jgi:hypothetical protein
VAAFCKRGNELTGSIKYGKFLDQLRIGWLLKDSAPWSKLRINVD